MTRQVRNLDQIRSLLRQMDRSVDDARTRREGTPLPKAQSQGQAGSMPSATPSASSPSNAQRPMSSNPAANPNQVAPRYPNPPTSGSGQNGSSMGAFPPMKPNGAQSPNSPPRLKAKPKRSPTGSHDDPLQDFQQRQAS